MGQSVGNLGQSVGNLSQQARERLGQVHSDDITELPEEYISLENRVDGLKNAHASLLKIAKAYDNEAYDYPTQVQESMTLLSTQVSHSVTSWAASAAKGTNLPPIQATSAPENVHRTLPHALSRAAASGAIQLGASPTNIAGLSTPAGVQPESAQPGKLAEALQKFALAQDRLGNARLSQDEQIRQGFLKPWTSFGSQLAAATKARQSVNSARLHLDSWKATLKASEAAGKTEKVEHQRNEVEKAEDSLVAATEEAISAMKSVTENDEPVKSLAALIKAQADYHKAAGDLLGQLSGEMAQLALSAEGEYRASRS
ncbi:hypothetical protein BDZ90DRAFT_236368 [Jaminaea rosea]|uniref:BAR domain-containing protein n=1 Tax=Jaminaea rosea TaxID=1569628 RepID=A0A316V1Z5_9BASI|nr:hypothetical protein BDZ90DRAFT_236368 [Jaminaea rosea]PWN31018.1 hypothetical protein BDZ90DRAFT_236368 [Jaminaea rosea]